MFAHTKAPWDVPKPPRNAPYDPDDVMDIEADFPAPGLAILGLLAVFALAALAALIGIGAFKALH